MTIHTTLTEPDHNRLAALTRMRDMGESACKLQQQLRQTSVVPPQMVDKDVVTMNSRVRVRYPHAEEAETFDLAFPDSTDGGLSVLSPLGAALLGSREGQSVECAGGRLRRRVTVEWIEYQPEREQHFDR